MLTGYEKQPNTGQSISMLHVATKGFKTMQEAIEEVLQCHKAGKEKQRSIRRTDIENEPKQYNRKQR